MLKKLATIALLLPMLSNSMENSYRSTITMASQNKSETFARYLLKDKITLIKKGLNAGIDPNGTTTLGTPYVRFVSSKKALKLLYKHGLHNTTFTKALETFLDQIDQPVIQDHTLAILIAYEDPHATLLDREGRDALIEYFEEMPTSNPNAIELLYDLALNNLVKINATEDEKLQEALTADLN